MFVSFWETTGSSDKSFWPLKMHRRIIRYRKALTGREAAWSGLWFLTWPELGCQCSAGAAVPGSLSSISSVFGTGAKEILQI